MRKRFDSIVQSSIELEKWDVIRDKLKNDNDGKRSKKMYSSQMTMLHLTCRHNPPSDVVELLLEANPQAAVLQSAPYDEIPLHYATGRNMASTDVIGQLVRINPKTVSAFSSLGITPMHQACTFHAPYETLKVLVDADPDVLSLEDRFHRTPWDVAKVQYSFCNPKNWKILNLLWGWGQRQRIRSYEY